MSHLGPTAEQIRQAEREAHRRGAREAILRLESMIAGNRDLYVVHVMLTNLIAEYSERKQKAK